MLVSRPVIEGRDLLAPAKAGDEEAFRDLVAPHCGRLHDQCRRILGSGHDADDAVQDTLLRAWRGVPGVAHEAAVGSWLRRIARNVSLDMLDKRRRSPAVDDAVEPDAAAEDDSPVVRYERHEALERALTAAFNHLPARQRAVLILNDALGFSARESADALGTTTASVNSALQRARRSVDRGLPGAELSEDVEELASALERGDVGAVIATLTG